jgi:hypothetical protein
MLFHYGQDEALVSFHQVFKRVHVASNNLTNDFTIILIAGVTIHYSTRATIAPLTCLLYCAQHGHWQP